MHNQARVRETTGNRRDNLKGPESRGQVTIRGTAPRGQTGIPPATGGQRAQTASVCRGGAGEGTPLPPTSPMRTPFPMGPKMFQRSESCSEGEPRESPSSSQVRREKGRRGSGKARSRKGKNAQQVETVEALRCCPRRRVPVIQRPWGEETSWSHVLSTDVFY